MMGPGLCMPVFVHSGLPLPQEMTAIPAEHERKCFSRDAGPRCWKSQCYAFGVERITAMRVRRQGGPIQRVQGPLAASDRLLSGTATGSNGSYPATGLAQRGHSIILAAPMSALASIVDGIDDNCYVAFGRGAVIAGGDFDRLKLAGSRPSADGRFTIRSGRLTPKLSAVEAAWEAETGR